MYCPLQELREQKRKEYEHIAVFPCRLRVLPNCIFNTRDPIVVGVVVEDGVVKQGTPLTVPSKSVSGCTAVIDGSLSDRTRTIVQSLSLFLSLPWRSIEVEVIHSHEVVYHIGRTELYNQLVAGGTRTHIRHKEFFRTQFEVLESF